MSASVPDIEREIQSSPQEDQLSDRQVPSPHLLDTVLAQLEEAFADAIPLSECVSLEEAGGETAEYGVTWTKTGSMKMKKATKAVPPPRDPEELRARINLWVLAHAMAFAKMPSRTNLESATPTVATTYAEFLLGDKVRTIGSATVGGGVNPGWGQILRYDLEVRKLAAKLVTIRSPRNRSPWLGLN